MVAMNTNVVVTIAKYLPAQLIAKVFNKTLALTIYSILTNKTRSELLVTNLPVHHHVIEILALTNTRFDSGFDQLVPKIVNKVAKVDPFELLNYPTCDMDDVAKSWYRQAIKDIDYNLQESYHEYLVLDNLSEFRPDLFHKYVESNHSIHVYAAARYSELRDVTGLMQIYRLQPYMLQFCLYDVVDDITNYIIQHSSIGESLLRHLAAQRRFDLLYKFYDSQDDWSDVSVSLIATGYWGPELVQFLAKSTFMRTALYFEIDYSSNCPYKLQPSIPHNWHELLLLNSVVIAPALVLFAGILGQADVLTAAISYVDNDFLFEALLFFTTAMFNLPIVQQRLPKERYYHFNVENGKVLKINMTTMNTLLKQYRAIFNQVPSACFDIIDFTNVDIPAKVIVPMLNKLAFMSTINLTLAEALIANYSKVFINKKVKVAEFSSIPNIDTELWPQRKSLLIIAKKYFN